MIKETEEKEPAFKVVDRRRFTEHGDEKTLEFDAIKEEQAPKIPADNKLEDKSPARP